MALPIGLEIDDPGFLVVLVSLHVHEGRKALALAIIDAVGVARRLVGDGSGSVGRLRLDAAESDPHFAVNMHVVGRHRASLLGWLWIQDWLP